MTIKTKIAALAVAALTVAGSIASTTTQGRSPWLPSWLGFRWSPARRRHRRQRDRRLDPGSVLSLLPGAPVRRLRPLHRHRERLLLIF